MKLIALATMDEDNGLVASLHWTQAAVLAHLREAYSGILITLPDVSDDDLMDALGAQGVQIEGREVQIDALHVRDPDSACGTTLWVDGAQTELSAYDIDPGRGYEWHDWREDIAYAKALDGSQQYRDAVVQTLLDYQTNQYLTGAPTIEWTEMDPVALVSTRTEEEAGEFTEVRQVHPTEVAPEDEVLLDDKWWMVSHVEVSYVDGNPAVVTVHHYEKDF